VLRRESETMTDVYFLGIDVGSYFVKALLVSRPGTESATTFGPVTRALEINEPVADFYEQSSEQIWHSCCEAVSTIASRKISFLLKHNYYRSKNCYPDIKWNQNRLKESVSMQPVLWWFWMKKVALINYLYFYYFWKWYETVIIFRLWHESNQNYRH